MIVHTVMMAAPRRDPKILGRATKSWNEAELFPLIIAEPGTYEAGPDIIREKKAGVWQSWKEAAGLILDNHDPDADAVAILQDDALAHPDVLAPLKHIGLESHIFTAYTSPDQVGGKPFGLHAVRDGRHFSGALAMFFSQGMLGEILNSDIVQGWDEMHGNAAVPKGDPTAVKNIDSMIGMWAAENNVPILGCQPSLVEHIGCGMSTLGHDRPAPRKADRFLHPDSMSPFRTPEIDCEIKGYIVDAKGCRAMLHTIIGNETLALPTTAGSHHSLVRVQQKNDVQKILEITTEDD